MRDGLRGGRTEAYHLLYTENREEEEAHQMLYLDINSLYPFVAIENEFPAGKPTVLIGKTLNQVTVGPEGVIRKSDGRSLAGLIQCTVLPPDALFYPVLGLMCRGKSMYGLCRTCMEEGQIRFCAHKDVDRQITGTWPIVELCQALKEGYRLIATHELVVYPRTAPLFKQFYLPLARTKLACEGYPREGMTATEQAAYVEALNGQMPGLGLSSDEVVKNPARRNFAKLVSNAALGKLSQNDVRPNSKFVRTWAEVHQIRNHPQYKLKRIVPLDDNLCEAVYESREERIGRHKNTQVKIICTSGHKKVI